MSDLADILKKLSNDINSLMEWRKSVETNQETKQEDAGEETLAEFEDDGEIDTLAEFEKYIEQRRSEEERKARELEELRSMML